MVSNPDAPFVWFGGKSRAADLIWQHLGDVDSYVEPFAGSLAVLLGRPHEPRVETVNDLDGLLANAWRAIAFDPEATAYHADWPVSEVDLHARHAHLVGQRDRLTDRLMGDPDFFDAKLAGWWLWGINCWIGSGWCSGNGPWIVEDGRLIDSRQLPHLGDAGRGVNRQLPHLGDAGRGVNRKLPHLGDAGRGVNRKLPHLGNAGQGVNRKLPHLGDAGQGLLPWFTALAERLRRVRICCGDWIRVMGPAVLWPVRGICGVVIDPPYGDDARQEGLYAKDSMDVASDVRRWAIEHGDDPRLRIALCGYEGEHDMPDSWTRRTWLGATGYAGQNNENRSRETIWFSPHCLPVAQQANLFEAPR